MAEYSGMTPTVVIGLGGTGKEVLIKIRRMIVETYGSLDYLPIVSFLHIDTEQSAKVSEPQTVLGQDISLRPVEQVWAKVENAKAILNNLSSFSYLEEWFPNQLKGTDSILAGAGQIRALGKLAFTVNYPQIKNSFENAKQKIIGHEKYMLDEMKTPLDKGINIFVVCSLMDEPFGALDLQTKEVMQKFLQKILQCTSTTILMITHDIEEAIFLSQRIYVLTSQPGTVKQEIQIELPKESTEQIKYHPVFINYKYAIIEALSNRVDNPSSKA